MRVGLIGHRGSGKTTIFNVLTGQKAPTGSYGGSTKEEIHLGVIKVPDTRLDRLAEILRPRKTTQAEIVFTDFPGDSASEKRSGQSDLSAQMREVDAMALVLCDFIPEAKPLKELDDLLAEMILSDLAVVEKRLARLKKEKGRDNEVPLLERCLQNLENEAGLRDLSFTPEEENLLSGFGLLSRKPVLALFNTAEERAGKPLPIAHEEELRRRRIQGLAMSGKVEMEIAQLDEADRAPFLKEIGIPEPARDRFIRACFQLMDLVSFFTTVSDELRAWTIKRGTAAKKAAGKIHTDMERGFIRAEVVAYEDFVALGSDAKCREAGKLRLEGKDYLVRDGDIVRFRFNV